MNIWEKISTQLKGLIHDGVDAVSDDGRTLRQALRDKDVGIQQVESALVEARTSFNYNETRLEKAKQEVEKYNGYAKKLVARGNEKLAAEALQDADKESVKVGIIQKEYDASKQVVEILTERFEEMTAEREREQNQVDNLTARSRAAAATKRVYDLANTGAGNRSKNTSDVIARIEERIAKDEAGANTLVNMHREKKPVDKYAELNSPEQSIEDRLAALREEVGK